VTLVGEADRKILKAAIKHSSGEDKIRHRIIPAEVVQIWFEKIESLNCEIADILTEEKEERQVCSANRFLGWSHDNENK
jgi:ATP-dependent RNA helicase DDX27